jgi:F-type H+-transporting ATPase subunit b
MEGEVGLVSIQWWTIILQIVNTLILFAALSYFLFKPVTKFMQDRKDKIAADYEEAEKTRTNAQELKVSYESKLETIKDEGRQIIRDATRRGEVRSEEIIKQAQEESKKIIERANLELTRERTKAMDQLKNDMIEIALGAASRVIEDSLEDESHERLIRQYIEEMRDVYV